MSILDMVNFNVDLASLVGQLTSNGILLILGGLMLISDQADQAVGYGITTGMVGLALIGFPLVNSILEIVDFSIKSQ